ncbi:unnamed protein product [Prorocentrum cordatum]|uniref:Uncharacterized protein n=1 Tax=Prorocentrum cordatum TaxID=2364126 RepID=A0ABN9S8L2_9DINO|nr:unnamed protein product [Polarella glacialis]
MASRAMCFAALLAHCAAAQQDFTLLLQSSASIVGEQLLYADLSGAFEEGSFGMLPEDAPSWCKNESQLSWRQRRERMQQHLTLEWSKKMVKQMLDQNETVPEWMDKIVSDDEKRGKSKWAVQESKRLKAEGKETPKWMDELVEEDAKWANRWAACKAAELREASEEVPQWMAENGRKGILEAATEKAAELQEEIEEMEDEKEKESALVDAQGDVQAAGQRMLARKRETSARTVGSQYRLLEAALEELDQAEGEMLKERFAGAPAGPTRRFKQALRRAKRESEVLNRLLEQKAAVLNSQMSAAH